MKVKSFAPAPSVQITLTNKEAKMLKVLLEGVLQNETAMGQFFEKLETALHDEGIGTIVFFDDAFAVDDSVIVPLLVPLEVTP